MPTVAVLGAEGLVGGLVVEELGSRGIAARPIVTGQGRDPVSRPAGTRAGQADDEVALAEALVGCALVIDASGGDDDVVGLRLRACRRAGVDVVDVSPNQDHLLRLLEGEEDLARAGIRVAAGAGLQHLVGDVLAHLAGEALPAPSDELGGWVREVHVAYTLPNRGGPLAAATAGRRRSAAHALTAPGYGLVRGERRIEGVAEHRRLAWFPRPVGAAHAASVPGAEALSVPRHLAGVQTVRTYLAVPGWRAELLQFAGNLARSEVAGQTLTRTLSRSRPAPTPARRGRIRWACVVEAAGQGGIARAWAYGHDPYRLTAVAAVVCAQDLLAGAHPPGVVDPSAVRAPAAMLDELSIRTDLRWSVVAPGCGSRGDRA